MWQQMLFNEKVEELNFPESFVASDLKIDRYRKVIVLKSYVSIQGHVYFLTN